MLNLNDHLVELELTRGGESLVVGSDAEIDISDVVD